MEKRNRHRKNQEKIVEQEATKTPFQKMLEERAKRLEMIVSKKIVKMNRLLLFAECQKVIL